ncbi:MAG: type II toxin-antitoxin system YafQ family toxin, partial [Thermodesulfobacteriota bacterium]|nr:type II toxin-antitoxin system YafQ family toxin [Thermodesulfobacteriota bacterium]
KYIKYLSLLLEGKALPLEARNHTLIGNYSGFKEFHIGGDVLVQHTLSGRKPFTAPSIISNVE